MKCFTKLFVIIGLITFGFQTQAQVKFGLKAGMNLNNINQNLKESEWEMDTKMRLAYHFGATIDYAFIDALSLQSGLLFTSKSFGLDLEEGLDEGETMDGYDRIVFNYIEIPIHFAFKISDFQIYAGPYIAIGIGGKNKWDYTYRYGDYEYSESDENKLKPVFGEVKREDLDDDEGAYNALDYGLNFGVGYHMGPILVNAGYSLGLGNITPSYEGDNIDRKDYKMSNRMISLSASYFFGE